MRGGGGPFLTWLVARAAGLERSTAVLAAALACIADLAHQPESDGIVGVAFVYSTLGACGVLLLVANVLWHLLFPDVSRSRLLAAGAASAIGVLTLGTAVTLAVIMFIIVADAVCNLLYCSRHYYHRYILASFLCLLGWYAAHAGDGRDLAVELAISLPILALMITFRKQRLARAAHLAAYELW